MKSITPSVVLQLLVFIVLVPFLPIIIRGDLGWVGAGVDGCSGVVGFVIGR